MRDQASDMLNTIGDITSRESSPTKNMDEGENNRSIRMRAGHLAMINLQGAMVHMRSGKNFKHVQVTVQVPLFPDTLNAFAEPQVTQ